MEIAKSQLGNVGGEPYWSWYGFGSRVEWCACFVSWCANQCGYIENGLGQRPLHMSDFDKAVLAIRDGELKAFKNFLPDLRDRADELFVKAAERPGIVGRKMCILILEQRTDFLPGIYRAACLKAVDIADVEKTIFLLEQAQSHVRDFPIELYGAIAE